MTDSTEKSRDGVLRTYDLGRVCCRSLKTEEREPKASTDDDELLYQFASVVKNCSRQRGHLVVLVVVRWEYESPIWLSDF